MNDLITSVYEDDGKAPAGWVLSDPTEEDLVKLFSDVRNFAEYGLDQDYLDERAQEHGQAVWKWEEFQKAYFALNGWYITNKARQTGGSLAWAAKKTIIATLTNGDYTAVATSITKSEAQNKIQYVRQFLDALPPRFKKKIIRDAVHLIEFENANRTRAKIISHAQKPLRGVHGDVGFDELAFYQNAKMIYESALPVVSQVNGHIDVISTPFGLGGMFYEIFSDQAKYPEFTRMPVMWWHCRRWLKDPSDKGFVDAFLRAPKMEVEERVYAFGNEGLKAQFRNLDLIIFRQEFEGFFIDELASFFNKELILRCFVNTDDSDMDSYSPIDTDFSVSIEDALQKKQSLMEQVYSDLRTIDGKAIHFQKYDSLHSLYLAVQRGEISPRLYGGADVGTTFHSADFVIIEEVVLPSGKTLQIERFRLNKRDWKLPDQEMYYSQVLQSGYILKLGMDTTGIGVQMGQSLSTRFPQQFRGFNMGGTGKITNLLMSNLKTRMEGMALALQNSKTTLEDLYAIKRVVGETKSVSFRAEENKRHHADGAWSTAIASYMGTPANEDMREMFDIGGKTSQVKKVVENRDGIPRINKQNLSEHFSKQSLGGGEGSAFSRNKLGLFIPNSFKKNYDR